MIAHLVGTPHSRASTAASCFSKTSASHRTASSGCSRLHFAGILARQQAIVLGAFTEYTLAPNDGGYDLDAAVARIREACTVPIYTGLPFGHCPEKLTLPIGGRCVLEVRDGRARLALSDYGR
jgi:muramoyltetrapeptide carboxypeptidase